MSVCLFVYLSVCLFLCLLVPSGKVHSTVKERWAQRDPSLVAGMQKLGSLADAAVACLQNDQGSSCYDYYKYPFLILILVPILFLSLL